MTKTPDHTTTQALQALDAAHHMHPFTDAADLTAKGTRVITKASGVFLTDPEGNEVLDGMSGLWCVNIGYGRRELAEVAAHQMTQLLYYNTFFLTTHEPIIALSARLAELAPGDLNHVYYAGSGSEANDTNIRIVRHYWAAKGKPDKTVTISRQSHWYDEGGDQSPGDFGLERARQLEEKIIELGEDRVAAFIAEPIRGAGGIVIPPVTYGPEVQRICDSYDILLIADEVICGFGRTGHWFGNHSLGIRPHIMTIAKGLTSGYLPMGGSVVCDEVAAVVAASGEFYHGYTFAGHPVTCALALENLRILESENILGHVRNVAAPYLAEKWAALADHPLVGEARSYGLLASVALTPDKARRAKFAGDAGTVGLRCRDRFFENNLVMRHVGDRMIITPPLIIEPDQIDTLIARAIRSLDETYAGLKADGLLTPA